MKHNQEHMDLTRKFSILLGMWPVKLSGWRSSLQNVYPYDYSNVLSICAISTNKITGNYWQRL